MNYLNECKCNDKEKNFARVWQPKNGIIKYLSFNEFEKEVVLCSKNLLEQNASLHLGEDNGILTIGLLDKGSLQFFVHVLAVQLLGLVPVLLNWRQPVAHIIDCLKDSNCQALLIGDSFLNTNLAAALRSSSILTILYSSSSLNAETFPSAKKVYPCKLVNNNQEAVLNTRGSMVFFTTGSTSRPKPVLHTHSTLMWTANNFVFPKNTTSTMCMLPNFHVLMTIQNFFVPYIRGIGICILHNYQLTDQKVLNTIPITAELVVSALSDLKPTTLDTVPFILEELASLPYDIIKPVASTIIRCGGAPLDTTITTKLISQYGLQIQTHYGQTEAPGMQLLTVPNAEPDEINIMLPPFLSDAGVYVSLVESTNELVLCDSKCSSPGYLSCSFTSTKDGDQKLILLPGKTHLDNSRHYTGDVFSWQTTRAGIRGLKFLRRTDDVLITSTGELVNPHMIESTVADAFGLTQNAVVVLGQNRSQPIALVEPSPQETISASFYDNPSVLQKVLRQVNRSCPEYARLERIIILDAKGRGDPQLPRSLKGTVIRAKAEAMLGEIIALRDLLDNFDDDDDLILENTSTIKAIFSSFWCDDNWIISESSSQLREADEQNDDLRIRKQALALLRDGKNSADLAATIEGIDSLTAVRLTQRWREQVRAQERKKRSILDRLKHWICPSDHHPAGRSLFSICHDRFAVEWYGRNGYAGGMGGEGGGFYWGLKNYDSSQQNFKQAILTTHEAPKTGRKMKVRIWYRQREKDNELLMPCILAVNGDAFYGVDDALPIPYHLIKLGFVVAQAERRGSQEGGVFPNALHDVAAAIRAIRGHADSFCIDPNRIAILGDSSGGWFATMIGALTNYDEDPQLKSFVLGNSGDFPHLSIDVACVVAICPPSRFDTLDSTLRQTGPWLFTVSSNPVESHHSLFLGHSCAEQPDRVRKATPQTYITAKTPPFFLTHGTSDPCVSHLQTQELFQTLRRASADPSIHEYLEIPGAGHCTYHFSQPDVQARMLAFLQKWLLAPQR